MATVYIPEALVQADMEGETVHMKMEGKILDILTKLDTKLYRKYITIEKVRPFL